MTLKQYARHRCPSEFRRWQRLLKRGRSSDAAEIVRLDQIMQDAIKADAIAGKINLFGTTPAGVREQLA